MTYSYSCPEGHGFEVVRSVEEVNSDHGIASEPCECPVCGALSERANDFPMLVLGFEPVREPQTKEEVAFHLENKAMIERELPKGTIGGLKSKNARTSAFKPYVPCKYGPGNLAE